VNVSHMFHPPHFGMEVMFSVPLDVIPDNNYIKLQVMVT
jgi:hypothetical protein